MQIQFKIMMAFLFAIAPLLSQAQNGITSAGTTLNSVGYSTAITIGEMVNTYVEFEPYALKSGILQPIDCEATNVSEVDDLVLRIAPNPATDFIQISSKIAEFSEYIIYDTNSKVICRDIISVDKISVSSIPAGIYVIQLKSDKELYSQLFTKI